MTRKTWEVDRWGQLNVIADGIAKDEMIYRLRKYDVDNQRHDDLPFDDYKIFMKTEGANIKRICSGLVSRLREEMTKKR